jgi:hypothetical protein
MTVDHHAHTGKAALYLALAMRIGLAALLLGTSPVWAQLEGALMPGKLIEGHAKYENDCANCHIKFNKTAQDKLCADCHKPVGQDIDQHQGMHGRIKLDACRTCHTEHKGRNANIAPFDQKKFDHTLTDFVLRDAHLKPKCDACHAEGKKFRDAPGGCNDCHKKDDKHKGSLGPKCADCHNEVNWKETRIDHDKTRFKLLDKHIKVPCADCHKNTSDYKDTPSACVGCHRKDDNGKNGHKGRYGDKCEKCHSAASWKESTFNHDTATKYPLHFKHRTTKCDSCHTGHLYRDKLDSACIACHRKEDKHNGSLGDKCGDCHNEDKWGKIKFDHDKTRFALAGKHADVECKKCHADNKSFKNTPLACVECHRKDDDGKKGHKGRYGDKCETCHTDTAWNHIRFSHDRDTKYALRGAHRTTKCDSCHTGILYKEKTPTACIGCHRKDDKHKNQLGEKCENCHVEDNWKKIPHFDHNVTRFPLLGRHYKVECKLCHLTPAFKDAKSDCFSCHEKDDKHKRSLGVKCETCHNARDWKLWDFDHDRKTKFVLDGGHKGLRCDVCHKTSSRDMHLPMVCAACHEKDDVHEGKFGRVCERCHVTTKFIQIKPGMARGVLK